MTTPHIEQLTATQKANAETVVVVMRSALDGMQKLADLNFMATREFLNTTANNAQMLMNVKDAKDLTAVSQAMTGPSLERVMDYSRNVYELVTQIQQDMTSTLESQYAHLAKATQSTLVSSPVAPGGDVLATAMKTMLEASSRAVEGMTAMAKQMSEMAEAGMATTTELASKVTKK